jgi:TetR/AcrR family transcriptional repressor of nem operon
MAGVRQFDEEQAFTQALAVFWRKGYRATSMLDLAEATGVQRGSLYNAYGDKEEIFIRVFERYTSEFIANARVALDFAIRSIRQGTPARGCLSTKTALDVDAESPRLREALQEMLDRLEAIVLDALSKPKADKQLAIPARHAAKLIVTMTRGIAVMERVYADPRSLKQTAASLIDAVAPQRS